MTLPFEQDNTKYGLSDFFHLCYLVVGKREEEEQHINNKHKQKVIYTYVGEKSNLWI